ncbi:DUF1642 domain-containing protein [Streptococcus infantis]|uniref:DUF1642 domain-containing protein n=1 Tax=Streptococcus infantis TaxID=68892 RepID=UPI002046E885|nr:MAG TPA: Protein of unknown function (DUF1642) [Caudoviricetes sp.]
MNKKELIERIKNLPFSYIHNEPYLNKEVVLEFAKHLDEPETGHADEAPRYVKNILARLRELPVHDREVWLKAIMGEFEQDFSRAKWREGYEQGKVEGMVERDKVKIPQFVADYIEWTKEEDYHLLGAMGTIMTSIRKNLYEWFYDDDNIELFARAWLDGYEVEKEPKYTVKIKATKHYFAKDGNGRIYFSLKYESAFTKIELEKVNLGWVFDCEGIEVEEVEE